MYDCVSDNVCCLRIGKRDSGQTFLDYVILTMKFSPGMLLLSIPLIALGIGMVYTLHSRIDEIRSGEEDDLSDY